mmetsp:Transcript_45980/g.74109  ORF Transcript_45980/g.74109 Transcript_45980/m.74109 type:complete len:211 (+) Transcript_45980:83-715(+)
MLHHFLESSCRIDQTHCTCAHLHLACNLPQCHVSLPVLLSQHTCSQGLDGIIERSPVLLFPASTASCFTHQRRCIHQSKVLACPRPAHGGLQPRGRVLPARCLIHVILTVQDPNDGILHGPGRGKLERSTCDLPLQGVLHCNAAKDGLHMLHLALFEQFLKGSLHGAPKEHVFRHYCRNSRAEKAPAPLDGAEKAHNNIRHLILLCKLYH